MRKIIVGMIFGIVALIVTISMVIESEESVTIVNFDEALEVVVPVSEITMIGTEVVVPVTELTMRPVEVVVKTTDIAKVKNENIPSS